MKALVVASTRPEVIKLAPVLYELKKQNVPYVFATTGQHYDDLLFKKFLEELSLEEPDYDVKVGSLSQANQTAKSMIGLEELLIKEEPDIVIVEGDTNSVLASALAAVKLKIPVAHVEAGLRSFDRTMPEEINRVLTDHCSEILFAPTEYAALNLLHEGIHPKKIHVVGNTIVDSTLENIKKADKESKILKEKPKGYMLLTLHRQENTDDPKRLETVLKAVASIKRPIIFPIHPRTSNLIKTRGLEHLLGAQNIHVIQPLGYLDFLVLLKNAFAVLTDSGGVQEEAITLGVPCLTLRLNTERPESVWAKGNIIVGVDKKSIIKQAEKLEEKSVYNSMKASSNPFGDGKASERIVKIILDRHEKEGLAVESSDTRDGYFKRVFIKVGDDLAGKKVKESKLEIVRIIESKGERFPDPELVLDKNMLIEVLIKF